ncbi:MAG TPA: transglutaminase-like cysteine peptidase [Xanthobacteraceae bacterium]|nr:transglutaminase-like cysteine peptidase [Xanthobacteraceae bacterium]
MRQTSKALAALALSATLFTTSVSEASFFSYPRMLNLQVQAARIRFDNPMLAPMAHVRFCLRYTDDCAVHGIDFRRRHIVLTEDRWQELNMINRRVNRNILPQLHDGDAALDQWYIAPAAGDCADYAVTKRHELLARGWPSRSLLLAEVVVPSGEHHLVLVVRMKDVDLVLDNLNEHIRTVAMTRYQYEWVRAESPYNPKFWSAVTVPGRVPEPMRNRKPDPMVTAMQLPAPSTMIFD